MKISNKKQYCQEKFWLVYYTLCLSLISQTKLFSCPQYAHLPLGNHQGWGKMTLVDTKVEVQY